MNLNQIINDEKPDKNLDNKKDNIKQDKKLIMMTKSQMNCLNDSWICKKIIN